ncbi:MAG TPA: carboxypeptidase regulatory-like domain-containing protein [Candidatus Thermoplasmatota archaeon]
MRSLAAAFGILYVLAILGGCVGGKAAPTSAELEDLPAGLGILEGVVLDVELQPLLGALVMLDQGDATTTDVDGSFRFRVPVGTYTLVVETPGFTSAQRTVDVIEAESVRVQILLERLPSDTPYVQVLTHTGFEVCGFAAGGTGATGETMSNMYGVPCAFGTPATSYPINVSESWRYTVLEMEWLTRDNMWFLATHLAGACGTDGDYVCWGQDMGTSPLRVEGAPGSVGHAQRYAMDGKKTFPNGSFDLILDTVYVGMFREEVNNTAGTYCNTVITAALAPLGQSWNPSLGCGLGYGYSTGYKFTYYASIFHYAAPNDPSIYSARPDA